VSFSNVPVSSNNLESPDPSTAFLKSSSEAKDLTREMVVCCSGSASADGEELSLGFLNRKFPNGTGTMLRFVPLFQAHCWSVHASPEIPFF